MPCFTKGGSENGTAIKRGGCDLFAHHPSGNINASREDTVLTQKLIKAAELFGIQVLDHIVLGFTGQFYSFREHGLL